jgi:DNA-binding NarL/FixJ family response regulator
MTGERRLRVVIGEDSVLLLAGLVKLLESAGFEVAATAGDGDALVAVVQREQPDLVIADVRMPPTHTDEGIRAALTIRGRWPDIAILVLSQYVEERYAADLLSTNTSSVGYLLKDRVADVTEFLDALRRVAAGGTALDPEVVAQLLLRRGADPLAPLTQRERDVLALMAEGRSNPEIAATLVITESAVSKHINSIFAKLGLHQGDTGHRRVLAVLRYLGAASLSSRTIRLPLLAHAPRPPAANPYRSTLATGTRAHSSVTQRVTTAPHRRKCRSAAPSSCRLRSPSPGRPKASRRDLTPHPVNRRLRRTPPLRARVPQQAARRAATISHGCFDPADRLRVLNRANRAR